MEVSMKKLERVVVPLEEQMMKNAEVDWKRSYGGITPRKNQFGRTMILPMLFANEWGNCFVRTVVDEFGESTVGGFRREYRKVGKRVIFKGIDRGRVPTGFRIGLIGLAFTKPCILSDFQLEIPYRNIVEEAELKIPSSIAPRTLEEVCLDFIDRKISKEEFLDEVETYREEEEVTPTHGIVFKRGYEIKEGTKIRLLGTVKEKGPQRVIPLGFCLYRPP